MKTLIALMIGLSFLQAGDLGGSRKGLLLVTDRARDGKPADVELWFSHHPKGEAVRKDCEILKKSTSNDPRFYNSSNPAFSFDENSVMHGSEVITFLPDGSISIVEKSVAQKKYGLSKSQVFAGKIDKIVYYSQNDFKELYYRNLSDGETERLRLPSNVTAVCGVARGSDSLNIWLYHTMDETRWWAPQAVNWVWTLVPIQKYEEKKTK